MIGRFYSVMIRNVCSVITVVITILCFPSCSVDPDDLIPENFPGENKAVLQKKFNGIAAVNLFKYDNALRDLLQEFKPDEISAGIYDYRGITIYLGAGRFGNADEAFGVISGLTAEPRTRRAFNEGELSYKNPYFTGRRGIFAFWIYSSTNPDNYFKFYDSYGEKFLSEITIDKSQKINNPGYISRLLPVQNVYSGSIIYVKFRRINNIDITNAYGAEYQAGPKTASVYISGFGTENAANVKYDTYRNVLIKRNVRIENFPPVIIGNPSTAFSYKEVSGYTVIYKYRRLLFFICGIPDLKYAVQFIRNIYGNMQNLKAETTPGHNQ